MARRRLHMRKTRQVLRLAMKERLPQRVIARSLIFSSSQGSSGPNKRQPLWQEVHLRGWDKGGETAIRDNRGEG